MSVWFGARVSTLLAAVMLALVPTLNVGHAQTTEKKSMAGRTAWGHPDLQGIWTTDAEIVVPLERPSEFGDRRSLTEAELAKREEDTRKRVNDDKADRSPGSALATPSHWFEVGNGVSTRTSLLVDPSNGRMPPMTAEAGKMVMDRRLETGLLPDGDGTEPMNGPEDTGLASRCITRGIPQTWIPSIYNNGFQIMQTPEYVAIFYERYHETRMIPLDGRPHIGRQIRQWIGDPRGRWEGNTLVVDVTNFSDKGRFKGSGETLHIVEHITRIDADTVNVAVVVDDPARWTKPWRFEVNGKRDPKYKIFEMACHEGNYTMTHILSAARALEKGTVPPPPPTDR
jgi:hypothetical protein